MQHFTIEEQNYRAFKYQESISDRLNNICEPLVNHLNTPIFGYMRFFSDGQYLTLTNQLSYQESYFENVHSNSLVWGEHIYQNQDFKIWLWPQNPEIESMKFVYEKNFWNGISITKISDNSLESWCFASDRSSTQMQNFYLRNTDILRTFIHHFNAQAADIIHINEHNHHKLSRYKNGLIWPESDHSYKEQSNIRNFLDAIKNATKTNRSKITEAESKCLYHLARGYTMKQIARNLNISPRTVEGHINNIKRKTGYTLRSDLIKFFSEEHELSFFS